MIGRPDRIAGIVETGDQRLECPDGDAGFAQPGDDRGGDDRLADPVSVPVTKQPRSGRSEPPTGGQAARRTGSALRSRTRPPAAPARAAGRHRRRRRSRTRRRTRARTALGGVASPAARGSKPADRAAAPSVCAAARSSSSRWVAITARRSREVMSGTVGGRIAWANTPPASAVSQIRIAVLRLADDERQDLRTRRADVEALLLESRAAARRRWRPAWPPDGVARRSDRARPALRPPPTAAGRWRR